MSTKSLQYISFQPVQHQVLQTFSGSDVFFISKYSLSSSELSQVFYDG